MEVLNRRERILAFLMFLLFFIIANVMLVVAVYFNFQLPWKENALLKRDLGQIQTEFDFQEKYSEDLKKVRGYIDSIELRDDQEFYYQQLAGDVLVKMQSEIPADSLVHDAMYENMLIVSKRLLNTLEELGELEGSKKAIAKLEEQLDEVSEHYDNVQRDLEVCRQLNRGR